MFSSTGLQTKTITLSPNESSRKIAIFVRLNEFCMDENQNIEYKAIWKDEYYKWICGFANANGGRIFLGVDDDPPHKPVGLDKADKLMEDLPNKVRDVLGIMVDVNLHHECDKAYIEMVVEPYPYPVNYKGSITIVPAVQNRNSKVRPSISSSSTKSVFAGATFRSLP